MHCCNINKSRRGGFFFGSPGMLYYCEHGGVDLMGLKPNSLDLTSFGASTLLVGSFDS